MEMRKFKPQTNHFVMGKRAHHFLVAFLGRMIRNHEEDEFVAVRVQDPRIQNEGYWNSYVDYKIFLHTNSKAFTAKTSCVRRRYSEFAWLKKKLQKNAGLVPVPDLPGKSFFSFHNEDFLENRRKGLQVFLDKVVHMTVCLSDSQLHLFLQTQLPVGHIQDCVQGLTPYTVTDAILTYASSNQGLAQAQEENLFKEPSLTVSYESMESPAPHQPSLQTDKTLSSECLSCGDSDPLDDILELHDEDSDEMQRKDTPSIRISQKSNHLEAVIDGGPTEATFYVGEVLEDSESPSPTEQTHQKSCLIQTPVEVHSHMGTGCEDSMMEEESVVSMNTEEKTDVHPDSEEKKNIEVNNCDLEKCLNSEVVLDLQGDYNEEHVIDSNVSSQEEEVLEDVSENDVMSECHGHVADVSSDREMEPESQKSDESVSKAEMCLQSETSEESHRVNDELDEEMHQGEVEQEVQLFGTKDESDEDSNSLPSSNESIIKCSEEESLCEETEAADVYTKTSPEDIAHWSEVSENILNLHINGCLVEKQEVSATDEEGLQYMTNIDLKKSPDLNPTIADGDLTENSDFSILESSSVPALTDGKYTEQETVPSLSLGPSEETRDVEVR